MIPETSLNMTFCGINVGSTASARFPRQCDTNTDQNGINPGSMSSPEQHGHLSSSTRQKRKQRRPTERQRGSLWGPMGMCLRFRVVPSCLRFFDVEESGSRDRGAKGFFSHMNICHPVDPPGTTPGLIGSPIAIPWVASGSCEGVPKGTPPFVG